MDLGRVQGGWSYYIRVKRDLRHDALRIGNCKSDLNCDSLPSALWYREVLCDRSGVENLACCFVAELNADVGQRGI